MNEICVTCGLPKNICVCGEISKDSQKIKIRVIRRKFGKIITLLTGFGDEQTVKELAKTMKRKLACGGTIREKEFELQGNQKERAKKILLDEGYKQELIET